MVGPFDSLADALIRQMNLQLEDMRHNGECSLLLRIIRGQASLTDRVAKNQETLSVARKKAGAILTVSRPKLQTDPGFIQRTQKALEETQGAIQETQRNIERLEAQLKDVIAKTANKDELRRAALTLADRENAGREELVELYHSISGVHWDQPDLGYVLSEEIAKPIRFSSCVDATNQLWEMINM
ncbi:Hypothetical protein GLP15_2452 [Giardia lamblia P15]|uniref:Kinetochore protein Spc24 n=1 Tax=Giardia intestinalis (strain P15) TaxID=658858 RepID=E1F6S1_GIAIA|nr:Hypothetical protein GLP15_2452 [Giardia lamblia P15]